MAKISLNNVASGYNRSKINQNFTDLESELNTKVLYRDNPTGEPNQMENDIDMNNNNINNVNNLNAAVVKINGNAVSVTELSEIPQASEVTYDNTTSGLAAINAQTAIDEVEGRVDTAEAGITTVEGRVTTTESRLDNVGAESITTSTGTQSIAVMGDDRVVRVESVAGLRATEPLRDDQQVIVADYLGGWAAEIPYVGPRGGGTFVYDPSDSTTTDDGGMVIVTAGGKRWKRLLDNSGDVSVAWFGARGNNLTNDAASVQSAVNYIDSVSRSGGYALLGDKSVYNLVFPKGVYIFEAEVQIPPYCRIIGNDSIIRCSASHFAFGNQVANSFFRLYVEKLSFQECNAFDISNNNQDTGKLLFHEVKFLGCPTAANIDCQSSHVTFRDCTWFRCQTVLNVITGDLVEIVGGWIKEGGKTANQQASIENAGKLYIRDLLGVPGTIDGFTETAWINNRATAGGHRTGYVYINGFRSGGESGSKTLVNNFAGANDDTNITATAVIIKNCDTYTVDGTLGTTRGVVRLFDVPNLLSMKDNTGFNSTEAIAVGSGVTLSTKVAGLEDVITFDIDNFKSRAFSFDLSPSNNVPLDLFSAHNVSKTFRQTAATLTLSSSVSGWTFVGAFTGGSCSVTLPDAVPGLEFTLIRSSDVGGGFFYRALPSASDTIRGAAAAGNNLGISSNWTGVTLKCAVSGFWEITEVINNSFGTGYAYAT